jgi:exopolysaccharide biosynthesis polyprenyl glycosylphosphotransferase
MYRRHRRKTRVLFGVCDALLTLLAFFLAYQTRLALNEETLLFLNFERTFAIPATETILLIGFSALAWILIGLWLKLYDGLERAHPLTILNVTVHQCAWGGVALVLFQYALRLELSRPFLFLYLAYSAALLLLFRLASRQLLGLVQKGFGATHYVLVVGQGEQARRVAEALEGSSAYGVKLVGFLSPQPACTLEEAPPNLDYLPQPGASLLSGRYPVFPITQLTELLRQQIVDEIIFAVSSRDLSELEDVLLLCDEEGVRTRVSVDFFPHVNSEVYLDHLYSVPLLTFSAAPDDELRLLVKRALDVTIAAAGLLLMLPLLAAVALAIKLTSRGPIIFRQVRCGFNGRRFVLYKFRSMVHNAEELKPSLLHLNEKSTVFKIANDPRLTPVGRILRKFSIDEWPQLWNVIRGDMSLVGPRPAVPEEVEQYRRWQRRRLRMRPGLTCLWTLAGRDAVDFESCMRMDMQYIDNWSLGLDWKIILRTIPLVVIGKGAH